MSNMPKVEQMGSLWETTKESILSALKITQEEQKKKKEVYLGKNELKISNNIIENNKDEIVDLLKKAGIKTSVYFPFKTKTNSEGELEFIPKNIFKMKKDAKKAKEQLENALKNKRITQDEFNMLSENLDDMLKENGLDEEKEEKLSDEDVEAMFETFNEAIDLNMDGLIASIGEKSFDKMVEDYEDMNLEERKAGLEKFNSKINQKLGIAGNLNFSEDENLKFENSFTKNGYMVSTKDVKENDLPSMLRNMMEKGMVRKVMSDPKSNMTLTQKKALVEKIMKEKKLTREQMFQNKSLLREYKN